MTRIHIRRERPLNRTRSVEDSDLFLSPFDDHFDETVVIGGTPRSTESGAFVETVVLSQSGTGGPNYPNQPANHIRRRESNASVIGGAQIDGITWTYNDLHGSSSLLTATDASAPQTPNTIARGTFGSGLRSGNAPFRWSSSSYGPLREQYMSMRVRFNSVGGNIELAGPGIKILGFHGVGQSNNNEAYWFTAGHTVSGSSLVYPTTFRLNYVQQAYTNPPQWTQNINSSAITLDTWHHLEFLWILNSAADVADGVYKYWKNGTLCSHHTTVKYLISAANSANGSAATLGFRSWKWEPTFGGNPSPVQTKTRDDTIDIDHVYISGINQ